MKKRNEMYIKIKKFTKQMINLYHFVVLFYLLCFFLFGDQFNLIAFFSNFVPLIFLPSLLYLPLSIWKRKIFWVSVNFLLFLFVVYFFGNRLFNNSAEKTKNHSSLTVLSYNVGQNLPDFQKLEQFINTNKSCDVLFLQEVTEEYLEQHLPHVKALFPFQFSGPMIGKNKAGMVMLSKHLLKDTLNFKLVKDGLVFQQFATIVKDDSPINLYNIHLTYPWISYQSVYPPLKYPYWDTKIREQEVQVLIDLLVNNEHPVILAGDFNFNELSDNYQQLTQVVDDAFVNKGAGFGFTWPARSTPTVPIKLSGIPFNRIDYIFYSSQLEAKKSNRILFYESDHFPVYAELEFK
ncbi:MAG: endonuclease/exonuclease/phosphatase family protein [Bacteroidota bacterium]